MRTRVVKWGNSLGLRIPKAFAEDLRITDGTEVELSLVDGQLVIRVVQSAVATLEDLLAGITDDNLHDEIDSGDADGREFW